MARLSLLLAAACAVSQLAFGDVSLKQRPIESHGCDRYALPDCNTTVTYDVDLTCPFQGYNYDKFGFTLNERTRVTFTASSSQSDRR